MALKEEKDRNWTIFRDAKGHGMGQVTRTRPAGCPERLVGLDHEIGKDARGGEVFKYGRCFLA